MIPEYLCVKRTEINKQLMATASQDLKADTLLGDLLQYNHQDLVNVLGSLANKFVAFAKEVDLDHPDLMNLFDGDLDKSSALSVKLAETIKLSSIGRSSNISKDVLINLRKMLGRSLFKFRNNIDSPRLTRSYLRFISSVSERNKLRSTKSVDLDSNVRVSLLDKTNNKWADYPDNFRAYEWGNNRILSEIEDFEKKSLNLKQNGLIKMSMEVDDWIANARKKVDVVDYFGFQQISLTTSVIILAKALKYSRLCGELYCNFDQERCGPRLMCYKHMECRSYDHIIDFLDEYPGIGGKALFDDYKVLVPSSQLYHFDCEDDKNRYDNSLLDDCEMMGVLLGERDKKHYFINYWIH